MPDPQTSETERALSHQEIVEALLKDKTPVAFRASGPSMNPTVRSGDLVHVRPVTLPDLRRGEVVLFRQAGRLTLHRYVRPLRDGAIGSAGDAALVSLEIVRKEDICGVAKALERDGRLIRLDRRRSRWRGMVRFYLRPLRRIAVGSFSRLIRLAAP